MPGDIIVSTFLKWTAGLPLQKQVISIFSHIRDIPYALLPGNRKYGPEHILITGRGSCGPKHYLLGSMFTMLGIPVRYQTWPFTWNDPSLSFPPELRASAALLDVTNHLACQAQINGTWVLIDATWDLPLERVGFPVNRNWDGRSDTLLAVHPVNAPDIPALREKKEPGTRNNIQGSTGRDDFVNLFNDWLDEVRNRT
jgi:transglutaminase-like putative cysteine protease